MSKSRKKVDKINENFILSFYISKKLIDYIELTNQSYCKCMRLENIKFRLTQANNRLSNEQVNFIINIIISNALVIYIQFSKDKEVKVYMKVFFKFIGYCFAIWIIWMGITYLYGLWFVDTAKDVVKDFEQSYNEAVETQKNSLELVGNVTMTSSGGYGYYTYNIEGVLKNVSGKKLNYAQVSFVIYDSAGNNIGSAFDNINYLDADGTWKFKAIYFGQESNIKYSPVPEISSW